MTRVSGPDLIAIPVRDLQRSARFYEHHLSLRRMASSPPGVVAFETSPIPFAIREPMPDTNLEAGHIGLGVSLSLRDSVSRALHDQLTADGVTILIEPFDTPFGRTFAFQDPDGYALAIHGTALGAVIAPSRIQKRTCTFPRLKSLGASSLARSGRTFDGVSQRRRRHDARAPRRMLLRAQSCS
jgi:catechol 2,3-dioxygenase-like lactoylglutathione lyase family enzyme